MSRTCSVTRGYRLREAEKLVDRYLVLHVHGGNHRRGGRTVDLADIFFGRPADDLENFLELVKGRAALEEHAAEQHFGEDAAERPDVAAVRVLVAAEQDLGRAVPTRGHVVGQVQHRVRFFDVVEDQVVLVRLLAEDLLQLLELRLAQRPRQSEVRQLRLPISAEQDVRRLDVSVDHFFRVDEENSLHQLVEYVVDCLGLVLEQLAPHHFLEVRLHEPEHQIQVFYGRLFARVARGA